VKVIYTVTRFLITVHRTSYVGGGGHLSRYGTSLRAGRSGGRSHVEARFPAPFQTGPGANPASYIISTGSFPEVKRPERGVNYPPPSLTDVPLWQVVGWALPFTFKFNLHISKARNVTDLLS